MTKLSMGGTHHPLVVALAATKGLICLVGAGGKKTTMYALAALHPGRVALSSTSHMYQYDGSQVDAIVVARATDPIPKFPPSARVTAFAGVTDTPNRVSGLEEAQINHIHTHDRPDLFILKADGARARLIKAPAAHEPIVPKLATTVIPVVSARAFGRRLDQGIAHRPELLCEVMHVGMDEPLGPRHIASLLTSEHGALKGVGDTTVIPLINMVDNAALLSAAQEAARLALTATDRYASVVLAVMKERHLVEVVHRS